MPRQSSFAARQPCHQARGYIHRSRRSSTSAWLRNFRLGPAGVDRPKFTGSLAAPSSSRTATCAPYLRPPIAGPNGGNATEGAIRNASRAASSPSVWAQTGSAPRAETKIQMSQYRRVTWAVLKAYPSSGSHHALNSRRRASSCPWATSFEGLAHNCTRLPAVVRMVV